MTDIDEDKIKQLDGALLLVLRELLRQRRTTLAARRLGLSQSAVSHALARLRVLFDDELFVRRPHGLQPTRHALQLGPQVDELLAGMSSALGLATRFDPATAARGFRIAAPDHLATLIAPGLLSRFARRAPGSRFAFSQRLGEDALAALERDEIDLALGRFASAPGDLETEPLLDDRYCLVARRRHPQLRNGLTRSLYSRLDHVQISVAGDFRGLEVPDDRALPRRTIGAVPRFLMAFAVVAASDAVSVAPTRLAWAQAKAFRLELHELPIRLAPIRMLAVRRPRADPGTLWLLDQVKESIPMENV